MFHNFRRYISCELYKDLLPEELQKIKALVGEENFVKGKFDLATKLFDELATENQFSDFLTLTAYKHLN